MKQNTAIIIILSVFLSGCDLAPDYFTPEMPVVENWKNQSQANDAERLPDAKWWQQFGSEELSSLIAKATTQNNDLLAAAARIDQARALTKIAAAPLLPSLFADSSASRDFSNKPKKAVSSYRAGADLSYELDIFGRLRDAANSADQSLIATSYDRDAIRLSISAQVAQGYFNLLALNERVENAENNLKNAYEILEIIGSRFNAGALSQLELSQQKTLVASEESSLANLKQQREVAQNLLAVLLGETPESFAVKDNKLGAMKPPEVAQVLPKEILSHRPDIASLEAELRAANFDIGAARAAFLPSFDLSAGAALAANPASAAASSLFALAASISMPLFTGGELEGRLENATARQQELAANYRNAALTAYGEVENALFNVENTKAQLASLTVAAQEAKKAADIASLKFKVGAIDFESLLNTQNSLLQTEDSLAQSKANRLSASVELFRALGGGF